MIMNSLRPAYRRQVRALQKARKKLAMPVERYEEAKARLDKAYEDRKALR